MGRKKGGKYASLKHKIPRYEEIPEGNDGLIRLTKAKEAVIASLREGGRNFNSTELAKLYILARDEKKDLQEELKTVELRLTAITVLATQKFEEEEVNAIDTAYGRVGTKVTPYMNIKDKAAFRKWCIDNGMENELVLPWTTANALASRLLLEDGVVPDGMEPFLKTTLTLHGANDD